MITYDYIWLLMITYDYVWLHWDLNTRNTVISDFLNMGICSRPRSGSTSWWWAFKEYHGTWLYNIIQRILIYKLVPSVESISLGWYGMGWLSIHSLFAEEFFHSSSGGPCTRIGKWGRIWREWNLLNQLELRSSQSFTSNSFRAYKTI